MREYVVDYCLANYDAHYRNFIVDQNGNLRGVDKEQSLKYLLTSPRYDCKMDEYHPNREFGEEPPIYGKIFKDIEEGKIPLTVLDELHKGIETVMSIPANEYLDIFTPYAKSFGYERYKLGDFYERIFDRRDSLKEIEPLLTREMEQAKIAKEKERTKTTVEHDSTVMDFARPLTREKLEQEKEKAKKDFEENSELYKQIKMKFKEVEEKKKQHLLHTKAEFLEFSELEAQNRYIKDLERFAKTEEHFFARLPRKPPSLSKLSHLSSELKKKSAELEHNYTHEEVSNETEK